jgi:hypothetical protein
MVQKIVVLCDVHLNMAENAEQIDASTYNITFEGDDSYVIDLCPGCYETFAQPFYDLVMVCGRQNDRLRQHRKPKQPKVKPEPTFKCPCCDYGTAYLQQFRFHCFRKHDMSPEMYAEAAGTAGGEHRCPECGIGFKTPQGMLTHRSSHQSTRLAG